MQLQVPIILRISAIVLGVLGTVFLATGMGLVGGMLIIVAVIDFLLSFLLPKR